MSSGILAVHNGDSDSSVKPLDFLITGAMSVIVNTNWQISDYRKYIQTYHGGS